MEILMAVPMGILMGIINLMGMTIDTTIGNMMAVKMGDFHEKYDGYYIKILLQSR